MHGDAEVVEFFGSYAAKGDYLLVEEIDLRGVGSASCLKWLMKDVFPKSRGAFAASMIWESGDIEKLTVCNGEVILEGIEI